MRESLGRYRIESQLGEGAMADVYRAFDPQIARPLAVKLLKQEFLRDRQYADRFLREAKAAGALSHPNIVTIFDVGESEGTPYIAMELLEGRPLDQLLAGGAMDPITVLRIGIQLADALAFAHAQRVVHRDIKPSNIIVAPDGQSVKLLDFGIARVGDALFEQDSVRTQVGQVLGTPRYMSPEQALGGDIDGRSDLFSVGVLLYEMLSGKRAFPGASSATLAIQIVQRDPEPLAKIAPQVPGGVQFIVSKLMAKKPERRFATGGQLADAMRKELAALTAVGAEEGARHRYLPIQVRLPVLLAVITALLLGSAIWVVLSRQDRAMEQVALASGSAISSFVASNAGLRAVENATLPAAQQDWAPVEAFVRSASEDPTIRRIVVVGADGVVRASSDAKLTGRPYAAPTSGAIVQRRQGLTITSQRALDGTGGFRFVRPITYAGNSFGQVDVEVGRAELDAAARLARGLMAALALITLGGVALTSFLGARAVAQPIRRLKAALYEAARGNLDFRISHGRRDEFGELFDGFNLAAGALSERLGSVEQLALDAPSAAALTGPLTARKAASATAQPLRPSPAPATEPPASPGPIATTPPDAAAPTRDDRAPPERAANAALPPEIATATDAPAFEPAPPVVPEPATAPMSATGEPRQPPAPAAETAVAPATLASVDTADNRPAPSPVAADGPTAIPTQPAPAMHEDAVTDPAPASAPPDVQHDVDDSFGDRTQIYTPRAVTTDLSDATTYRDDDRPPPPPPPVPATPPRRVPHPDDEGDTLIGPARR